MARVSRWMREARLSWESLVQSLVFDEGPLVLVLEQGPLVKSLAIELGFL